MVFGPALILGALGLVGLIAATAGKKTPPKRLPAPKPPTRRAPKKTTKKGKRRAPTPRAARPKTPAIYKKPKLTPAIPVSPGIPVEKPSKPQMPVSLKQLMATALTMLGVNEKGEITKAPTAAALQVATATAGQLQEAGWTEAAEMLRHYIQQAAAYVPPTPPAKQVPVPGIPPELQEKINKAIQFERDPKVLRAIAQALKNLPNASDPQVQMAIMMLENLAAQIEDQQKKAKDLEEIEEVIKSPGIPAPKPVGIPVPVMPPVVVTEPPKVIEVPKVPVPQPVPLPKTPLQQAASALNQHLINLQIEHGGPKAMKGKENLTLVKKFQGLLGGGVDGKTGPGTVLGLAKHTSSGKLPLVMYWPRGSTASRVHRFRDDINAVADLEEARGNTAKAQSLRNSAARERGQGGIVGQMPA